MHTVALSEHGEVWCWGNGEYGRLGNGGSAHALEPEPLEFFEQTSVSQIAVGHAFTLALTEDGAVYCWGRNDQGQLGLGGGLSMDVYSMENYPRTIEKFEGITVTSLAAGHSHASAVSDEGKLYVWGMRLYLEPNEMTGLRGHKVIQTSCGGNYTAAITDNGDLYTFGKGRSTCLGHEDKKNKQQPTIVEGLKGFAVHSVSCGNRHAGAVAVPRSTAADRDFSMRQ